MKKKICIIVSSMYTVEVFLLDQLKALSRLYEIDLVANTDDAEFLRRRNINVTIIPVGLERKISAMRDIKALLMLFRLFLKKEYALIHSVTPKAGLLSMIAGFAARIPVRIHTFTGQVWPTRTGIMYYVLKWADRIVGVFSTDILTDSKSQLDFLIAENVVSVKKAGVLAHGSISGVDIVRFKPNREHRIKIRKEERIPEDAIVFLYMARLTKDKGALVMARAIAAFSKDHSGSHFLIIGPDEENLRPEIRSICSEVLDLIHFLEFTSVPEQYMAAADIFCLPSFREGFGTSLINAGAVGIPAIASRIYGSIDAVEDGITGLLFDPGNITDLTSKMTLLYSDSALRSRLGENGRTRARECFSENVITGELLKYYEQRLSG